MESPRAFAKLHSTSTDLKNYVGLCSLFVPHHVQLHPMICEYNAMHEFTDKIKLTIAATYFGCGYDGPLLEDSKKKTFHLTHYITKIGITYNDFSVATFCGCRSDGPLLDDSKKKIFHQTLTHIT